MRWLNKASLGKYNRPRIYRIRAQPWVVPLNSALCPHKIIQRNFFPLWDTYLGEMLVNPSVRNPARDYPKSGYNQRIQRITTPIHGAPISVILSTEPLVVVPRLRDSQSWGADIGESFQLPTRRIRSGPPSHVLHMHSVRHRPDTKNSYAYCISTATPD